MQFITAWQFWVNKNAFSEYCPGLSKMSGAAPVKETAYDKFN